MSPDKQEPEPLSLSDCEVLAWALRYCQQATTASNVQKAMMQTLLHRVERGEAGWVAGRQAEEFALFRAYRKRLAGEIAR